VDGWEPLVGLRHPGPASGSSTTRKPHRSVTSSDGTWNCRSASKLLEDLKQQGICSKRWISAAGLQHGGYTFARGPLYHLLKNRIYLGEATHKGKNYPGEHDAIIDIETFDAVQQLMASQAVRSTRGRKTTSSLLTGILFDDNGNRLTPSHAVKDGKRYRYYVTASGGRNTSKQSGNDSLRIPAVELDNIVLNAIMQLLQDQGRLVEVLYLKGIDATHIEAILNGARQAHSRLVRNSEHNKQATIRPCVQRVVLGASEIRLELSSSALLQLCNGEQESQTVGTSCRKDPDTQTNAEIVIPMSIRRRGIEKKLVLSTGMVTSTVLADQTLVSAIALARKWFDKLMSGEYQTLRDLARADGRGGERGIRTPGTLARSTVFETAPFNHSGTSPRCYARQRGTPASPSGQRSDT
jgi:site-specific DNA recombinase